MTIPIERYNSLKRTEELLKSMIENKWIPKATRDEAYACLRHYPYDVHLEELAKECPHVLQTKNDG